MLGIVRRAVLTTYVLVRHEQAAASLAAAHAQLTGEPGCLRRHCWARRDDPATGIAEA